MAPTAWGPPITWGPPIVWGKEIAAALKRAGRAPYAAFRCCCLLFPGTTYCCQALLTAPGHYYRFNSWRIYSFGFKFGQIVEY